MSSPPAHSLSLERATDHQPSAAISIKQASENRESGKDLAYGKRIMSLLALVIYPVPCLIYNC